MRAFSAALACLFLATGAGFHPAAWAQDKASIERVAGNLYLVRDKPGTQTELRVIVRAGCLDEPDGKCRGLAHFLEHLAFGGTTAEQGDGNRFRTLGRTNAFTSHAATWYLHSLPSRPEGPATDLEKLFAIYADGFRKAAFDEALAERERKTIEQEFHTRISQSAITRFVMDIEARLLPGSPYASHPLGTREDIAAFTLTDAEAFHARHYRLDNSIFLVRAAIDAPALLALAQKALGPLPSVDMPELDGRRDADGLPVAATIERSYADVTDLGVIEKRVIRLDRPLTGREDAAFRLLTAFLASRLPGSLHAELIDRSRVARTTGVSLLPVGPSTMIVTFGVDAAEGVTGAALLAALRTYIDRLAESPPDARTIERLKLRTTAAVDTRDQQPDVLFSEFAEWMRNLRTAAAFHALPALVEALTPADVASAARELAVSPRRVGGIVKQKEEIRK